ncbi:unnamed protein product [Chironomus riparius]|uniref:peptidylprolyl isomerase n=1 Tax=Chironomus riparius TaxID=315576 RepID=A0A9N9S367_9DIPT|nr:unnamed protein product [Chironomus riparius]
MSETRCYFDITINNIDAGRIVFELFPNECPKTSENFRQLCTGEAGIGKVHDKQLYYKGIIFHRVVKGFMIQSGDFINSNGTSGESIYGKTFDDENLSLKHEKPFLLSMANRGKNTNSSQFFITTAPASHLDGIHTVFGRVVSGQDIVRQIEDLPVDRNSRPLDEAMVKSCGELVKQVKEKKEKKKKKVEVSDSSDSTSSDSSSEDEKKKKRKKKKEKKKSKKASKHKENAESSIEEGELESDTECLNPLVSVTKIDPKEIPEVNNKFLMRSERPRDDDDKNRRSEDRNGSDNRREKNFGWSKRYVPQSRSGRVIKGRGSFRYRTPSRSRSRSVTPEHWKAATRKLIKFSEFEKLEEVKRQREDEIKRRTEERKKRHEAISRGDGKKSFFELGQETTTAARVEIEYPKEPEKSINDELDYEADDIVEELQKPEKKIVETNQKARIRIEMSKSPDRIKNIRKRSKSRSKEFDRRNRDRKDFPDYRRRQNDGRNFERNNRFDRFRRDDRDRDRNQDNFGRNRNYRDERVRRKSRSNSRSRYNRRRSSERKRSLSPQQPKKPEEVVENSKKIDENPKMKYNETDIEDLERRVLEAKKVLEIIVKEKEKEEEEKRRRSLSRSSKRSDKKKRRRHSDSSD